MTPLITGPWALKVSERAGATLSHRTRVRSLYTNAWHRTCKLAEEARMEPLGDSAAAFPPTLRVQYIIRVTHP